MKIRWDKLGGQAGIGFCLLGFLLVFLGWNGAASWDRVPSQFPYLISGGIAGLSLVILGVGLMVIQNHRQDRAYLEARLGEIRSALERLAVESGHDLLEATQEGLVVAGASSYHSRDCHLVDGRTDLAVMSADEAAERGLSACRVCRPNSAEDETLELTPAKRRGRGKP